MPSYSKVLVVLSKVNDFLGVQEYYMTFKYKIITLVMKNYKLGEWGRHGFLVCGWRDI